MYFPFWNCGSGAKRRLRLADAIVRCCLRTIYNEKDREISERTGAVSLSLVAAGILTAVLCPALYSVL